MGEKWVLLWSQSQCVFHIEQVRDMLMANARAFNEDRRMDYVPLFIGTRDEVDHLADHLRPRVHERQDARTAAREAIDRAKLA